MLKILVIATQLLGLQGILRAGGETRDGQRKESALKATVRWNQFFSPL